MFDFLTCCVSVCVVRVPDEAAVKSRAATMSFAWCHSPRFYIFQHQSDAANNFSNVVEGTCKQSAVHPGYAETFSSEATNQGTDFACHLQLVLNNEANLSTHDFPDVVFYIQALPLERKEMNPDQRIEFDKMGVALWNICCKLRRNDGASQACINLAKGMTIK